MLADTLVLMGNRQLLSGFLAVVVLLAAAFAMGYAVGQNSPHPGKASDALSASSPISLTSSDRPSPPAPVAAAPPIVVAAPPGSYWQVTSVTRIDAEVVARALRNKGLSTSLS